MLRPDPEWIKPLEFHSGVIIFNRKRSPCFRLRGYFHLQRWQPYWQNPLLIVVDRHSVGYEAGLSRTDFRPTLAIHELAEYFFGRLRVTSGPIFLYLGQELAPGRQE
jgi:hypothetical protein